MNPLGRVRVCGAFGVGPPSHFCGCPGPLDDDGVGPRGVHETSSPPRTSGPRVTAHSLLQDLMVLENVVV